MKKIALFVLAMAASSMSFADGYYRHHRGHHHHHHGVNGAWIAAPIVGAVAGAIIYNATRPDTVYVQPQPVYVPPQPVYEYCNEYSCRPQVTCTVVPLYSYEGRVIGQRQYCQ